MRSLTYFNCDPAGWQAAGYSGIIKSRCTETRMRGLMNLINRLMSELANPSLTAAERAAIQSQLSEASTMLDEIELIIPR